MINYLVLSYTVKLGVLVEGGLVEELLGTHLVGYIVTHMYASTRERGLR